jgi:hypothetical protein
VGNEIAESLVEFLTQRFSADEKLLSIIKPFIGLSPDADLEAVPQTINASLLSTIFSPLFNMP